MAVSNKGFSQVVSTAATGSVEGRPSSSPQQQLRPRSASLRLARPLSSMQTLSFMPTTAPVSWFNTVGRKGRKSYVAELAPSKAGYLLKPECLRKNLEQMASSFTKDTRCLVENIKKTLWSTDLAKAQPGGNQQDLLLAGLENIMLSRSGGFIFQPTDFPLYIKVCGPIKSSNDRALLLPVLGSFAHALVVQLIDDSDMPSKQVMCKLLIAEVQEERDLGIAITNRLILPTQLDDMRKHPNLEIKTLGEVIVLRVNYLLAEDTSLSKLTQMSEQPQMLSTIKNYKRDLTKQMRTFCDQYGGELIPENRNTAVARGMFLVLLEKKEEKDIYDVNKTMAEAMKTLREKYKQFKILQMFSPP